MTELLAYWPTVALGVALLYGGYRYVRCFGIALKPTPAERARERGELRYDEELNRFVTSEGDDDE